MRMLVLYAVAASLLAPTAMAQSKYNGIPKEHHAYTPADGVVEKDVTYYSDGVACWARIFYPKNFDASGKTPAIVVSHGWTGTHHSLLKYGNRYADAGFVAMVIDYRSWGNSNGYANVNGKDGTADDGRTTSKEAHVTIKRTRLVPMDQVQDIRNAISYIQGEPGVDRDRIGLWGSSYAGGHVLTVASYDPRVKAIVSQVSGINARPEGPTPMWDAALKDAIKRARTGQGGEYRTGFSTPRMVDLETQYLASEYKPMNRVQFIPDTVAVFFQLAENEELINNDKAGKAAYEKVKGPKKLIVYPGVGHFDVYIEDNFPQFTADAIAWYKEHL